MGTVLNKEVCIMCINKRFGGHNRWNVDGTDEDNWNKGFINCDLGCVATNTNDNPPEWCDYKLEHLIIRHDNTAGK